MAKVLRCRDVGMDCDFVAQADTEEEILQQAATHARMVHNMQEIPVEVIDCGARGDPRGTGSPQ